MKKILDKADKLHIHDAWTQDKFLHENAKYKESDIYNSPRDPKVRREYQGISEAGARGVARQGRDELRAAGRYLEFLALREAPVDPDRLARIDKARANPSAGIGHQEVLREFGL
ncbi:MAG: hypothetical protein ABJC09_09605 [Terriglobia bacterium]